MSLVASTLPHEARRQNQKGYPIGVVHPPLRTWVPHPLRRQRPDQLLLQNSIERVPNKRLLLVPPVIISHTMTPLTAQSPHHDAGAAIAVRASAHRLKMRRSCCELQLGDTCVYRNSAFSTATAICVGDGRNREHSKCLEGRRRYSTIFAQLLVRCCLEFARQFIYQLSRVSRVVSLIGGTILLTKGLCTGILNR